MPILVGPKASARDSQRNQQAMTVIRAHIHPEEENHDDMTAEALALMSISIAATYLGAGGDPSMLAIPGAMLASFIALCKATQEKRGWPDKVSSVVGTSVIGSTAPSAIIHWCWPDILPKMIWQSWSLLGFLGGLMGWSVAYAFVKVTGLRSEKFANSWLKRQEERLVGRQESSDGRGNKRQNGPGA
jgi:hypothetical protein